MFSRESEVEAEVDGSTVRVQAGSSTLELSRTAATALREAVGEALTQRREFLHTEALHREDGSYVVGRRGANSTGNEQVFESFEALTDLFTDLPRRFDATAIGNTGVTGSRRHMLVWHLVEHPAFPCELASRNPLTGVKSDHLDQTVFESTDADSDPTT